MARQNNRMEWHLASIFGLGLILWLALKRAALVAPQTARDYLKQGAKVIDVRNPDEFQSGHLSMAINLPLDEIAQRITREAPDKDTILLLHCLGGFRSGVAQRSLRQMGYTRVFNLGSLGRAQKIFRAQP